MNEKSMRVVILGLRGFPDVQGGVETHGCHLYPHLAGRRIQITLLARRPYVRPDLKEYKNIQIKILPSPRSKFLEAFVHTFLGVFAAKRLRADILHVHAIGPALFVPLARLLGLRVVLTHHGPDYDRQKWGRLAKSILRLGEYLGVRFAHEVIAISADIALRIKKTYGRLCPVIPNGVIIHPLVGGQEALRIYGLHQGRYVLAVGRLVPEKGWHDLFTAFETMGDWKLVIVGKADYEDSYSRDLKRRAQDNPNIVMTGFLTGQPLFELYSHAGLFVLPSYYEGLPIVLLEAMSYRVSCLASDIPPHREVGLSQQRLFRPGDVGSLRQKLLWFMRHPIQEPEQTEQVRMLAQRFDWTKIAQQTEEVYWQVLGR